MQGHGQLAPDDITKKDGGMGPGTQQQPGGLLRHVYVLWTYQLKR